MSINSLNQTQGTTINALELALYMAEKSMNKVVQENPKAGLIVAKGQENEARLRYTEAIQVMKMVKDYFASKGCFSFGICLNCAKFKNTGTTPKYFGHCGEKSVHAFDTCPQHSKRTGGFGL